MQTPARPEAELDLCGYAHTKAKPRQTEENKVMLVALRGGLPDKCQIAFALLGLIFSEDKRGRKTREKDERSLT